MGVGKRNDAGEYIDKNGKVIPKESGTIDTSKIVWEANEGIRISVILHDLFSRFPDTQIIKKVQIKPNTLITTEQTTNTNMESNQPTSNINISFPSSLIDKNGIVNISINQGATVSKTEEMPINTTNLEALDFAETKKLETAIDFSACKGYQSSFLGSKFNIELPKPMPSIKKFIAKEEGTANSIELKYHHYSSILHSVRKMPIISAINVDGDPKKRMDTSTRKDVWLRDTRLSFDIQLSDAFYKGSGFDRGHMSRREDANWGATPEEAKRNADLTCMHTNACPQVAQINQSGRKGLWGILEKLVLESGAENEKGKTAKISVFNGPIFKESDPVFRGVQVPMDFYKIVLWLTDKGALKATAFKLSQVNLVADIDFEELNLDQNTEFKEYQCSIKSLQEETQIDFAQIIPYDTFRGNKQKSIPINSKQEVVTLINKHKVG
jgi:endonuclease G, mitochondrial